MSTDKLTEALLLAVDHLNEKIDILQARISGLENDNRRLYDEIRHWRAKSDKAEQLYATASGEAIELREKNKKLEYDMQRADWWIDLQDREERIKELEQEMQTMKDDKTLEALIALALRSEAHMATGEEIEEQFLPELSDEERALFRERGSEILAEVKRRAQASPEGE